MKAHCGVLQFFRPQSVTPFTKNRGPADETG
jgi:hypothetical protein